MCFILPHFLDTLIDVTLQTAVISATSQLAARPLQLRPTASQICTGNASEICGGADRLSHYEWTGTPPYTWHTPSGGAAGEYQFLTGGLVVPLISTPGVNGKVRFVEKARHI